MVGQYKAKGNILLLPILGNGAANLTFGMNNSMKTNEMKSHADHFSSLMILKCFLFHL